MLIISYSSPGHWGCLASINISFCIQIQKQKNKCVVVAEFQPQNLVGQCVFWCVTLQLVCQC